METKKDIRKRVLNRRENIKETEWDENSRIIYENVVAHSFFLDADIIYCYMNYKKEVRTREIIKKAWGLGKTVAIPKIVGNDMRFYSIQSFDDIEEGYNGIPEPFGKEEVEITPGLVIVPGVAFDQNRNRIGYGKGYYDRFLQQHPQLKTIAIAFELQLEDEIPVESFDLRPEILITEEHIYV